MELDAGVQKTLVRLEELRIEIGRIPVLVDVVARRHNEIEWVAVAPRAHAIGDPLLRRVARPEVADDQETETALGRRLGFGVTRGRTG
jgi:hypothetical protein